MTGPSNGPVDVMAILADLQQQVSDLTGVVEAQQSALRDLSVIVQSQDHALRQLPPDSPLLSGRSGGA
jgi:alkyl hydroperoxide reductase subunit AhpC